MSLHKILTKSEINKKLSELQNAPSFKIQETVTFIAVHITQCIHQLTSCEIWLIT